ncbi:MAG: tyrosine--tRNA ligase, partial [Patescibacteria group bacterium]
YNSTWLKNLGFAEIGKMADLFGLHEFAARENIKKRLDKGKRVSLRELLYPLMQGYDSVAVKADVELGGTDQRFNLLAGRTIQPLYGQASQNIIITQLLEGTDGKKMSSSWGNVINITDSPDDMFGKVMAVRDDLMKRFARLAANLPEKDIKALLEKPAIEAKEDIAEALVRQYHGVGEAEKAREFFESAFRRRGAAGKGARSIPYLEGRELFDMLEEAGEAPSKSEWRRLILQRAVEFEGRVVGNPRLRPDHAGTVRVGKKKFFRLEE